MPFFRVPRLALGLTISAFGLVSACEPAPRPHPFQTTLDNKALAAVVAEYVRVNAVDTTSHVVLLTSSGCAQRSVVRLEETLHNPYLFLDQPVSYTVLAGAVVVIYDEHTVYHPIGLKEDLAATLRERGVHLEEELARTYDPVIWEIHACGGRLVVYKNPRAVPALCEPCQP